MVRLKHRYTVCRVVLNDKHFKAEAGGGKAAPRASDLGQRDVATALRVGVVSKWGVQQGPAAWLAPQRCPAASCMHSQDAIGENFGEYGMGITLLTLRGGLVSSRLTLYRPARP